MGRLLHPIETSFGTVLSSTLLVLRLLRSRVFGTNVLYSNLSLVLAISQRIWNLSFSICCLCVLSAAIQDNKFIMFTQVKSVQSDYMDYTRAKPLAANELPRR